MIKVASVVSGSIADELGIVSGTDLLSVNGRVVEDFLDWEFHTAEDQFLLHVRQPDGEELEFDIERPAYDPLGIDLEPPRIRRCGNRCDFCFVDGLPEGLRDVLYVRDDDYRLSFRYGNFATLTNLKQKDLDRIIEYRLSPLYVSVHATDPVVRRWLLRNPAAPDVLEQLRMLSEHSIQFHTQVVLSPGVNDAQVLDRTLEDLYAVGDPVLTVSVVPVGLTEYSKHSRVREPTREECRSAVAQVESWSSRALQERGTPWAFGADELYLRADLPLPPAAFYGEFDQVENGVGSVRFLQHRIAEVGAALRQWEGLRIGVMTGTSMGRLMPEVLEPLTASSGATFELMVLENQLFGPSVTCAGLLSGRSFTEALSALEAPDLDLLLLPAEAVNDNGLFLDDLSFESLQRMTDIPIRLSKTFVDVLPEGGAA
jgi:putative radical SAM enzyme (TIGR03279 family)